MIRIPEEIIEIALGRQALLLFFCAASLGFKWSVFSLWFRMQAKGEGILDALARGSIILSAHTVRSRLVLHGLRMTGGGCGAVWFTRITVFGWVR